MRYRLTVRRRIDGSLVDYDSDQSEALTADLIKTEFAKPGEVVRIVVTPAPGGKPRQEVRR